MHWLKDMKMLNKHDIVRNNIRKISELNLVVIKENKNQYLVYL